MVAHTPTICARRREWARLWGRKGIGDWPGEGAHTVAWLHGSATHMAELVGAPEGRLVEAIDGQRPHLVDEAELDPVGELVRDGRTHTLECRRQLRGRHNVSMCATVARVRDL